MSTQGSVLLRWLVTETTQGVHAEVVLFWFDWYLACCGFEKGNIASGSGATYQRCLAEWHNCWTVHAVNSIHWWYLQLVHSILVCGSVHWEAYLLVGFWWGRSKSALYVNFNTWLIDQNKSMKQCIAKLELMNRSYTALIN